MPTYDYICDNCGYEFETFQSIKSDALKKCEKCGKDTLRRLIGGGAGLIFKGSGFYLTDYKNKSAEPSKSSTSKAETKGDTAKKDTAQKDSGATSKSSGTSPESSSSSSSTSGKDTKK